MADSPSFSTKPSRASKAPIYAALLGGAAIVGAIAYFKSKPKPVVATPDPDAKPLPPPGPATIPVVPELRTDQKIAVWRSLSSARLRPGDTPDQAEAVSDATVQASTSALRDIIYRNQSQAPTVCPDGAPASLCTPSNGSPGAAVLLHRGSAALPYQLWFLTPEELKANILEASKNYAIFLRPDEWQNAQAASSQGEVPLGGASQSLDAGGANPGGIDWSSVLPGFGIPSVALPTAPSVSMTPTDFPKLDQPREMDHAWKVGAWKALFGRAFVPFVSDPALPYLHLDALGASGTMNKSAPQTFVDQSAIDPSLALLIRADDEDPNNATHDPVTFWMLPEAQAVEVAKSTTPGSQWLIFLHGNGEVSLIEDEAGDAYHVSPSSAPTNAPPSTVIETQGGGV